MTQRIELAVLNPQQPSPTYSGKLRLLGFNDLAQSVALQDCEHWTKATALGLAPVPYQEAVLWASFMKGEYYVRRHGIEGFSSYYCPEVPEPVLDLVMTLVMAGTFAEYRILTTDDNREAMLLAFEVDEMVAIRQRMSLCVYLCEAQGANPAVYRLARWCNPPGALTSLATAASVLRNRIQDGQMQYMSKSLRVNALEACDALST